MQSASSKAYFKRLLRDGHRWQYTDVWLIEKKPRLYFSRTQWAIFFISMVSMPFIHTGFSDEFVANALTALSIFVGLFLTLILTAFDKFKALPKPEKASFKKQDELFIRRNFFKQFSSLTAYAIVLSLLCIVLLGIASVSGAFKDSLHNHPIAAIRKDTILRFILVLGQSVYNGIILYFLLDFLVIVLYAVTSIHAYMQIEFDMEEKDTS